MSEPGPHLDRLQPATWTTPAFLDEIGLDPHRPSASLTMTMAEAEEPLLNVANMPATTWSLYQEFARTGDRRSYETPYFRKRDQLSALALQAFFAPRDGDLDRLCDHIWNVCEETTWVLPAHARFTDIDLFCAETAFALAEACRLLADQLPDEIIERVRAEVERRALAAYLDDPEQYGWHSDEHLNNWSGVCNASLGAALLHLERDPARLRRGAGIVLRGLERFLATAFERDGASTEGVGYWHYGLVNVVAFAELLRARTGGAVDVLASPRMRAIAAYPLNMLLSPGRYAAFSDSAEPTGLCPGIIARLAQRSGRTELAAVLAEPAPLAMAIRRLPLALRNVAWWDGRRPPQGPPITTHWQKDIGTVRLVENDVVLMAKAGHNAENHNQNDVGSFILHAAGETLLCDPGAGLYTRQYFDAARYDNVFNGSQGHSVPLIGGRTQIDGRAAAGEILSFDPDSKQVQMQIAAAYDVPGLESVRRTLALTDGALLLDDAVTFSHSPVEIAEVLVTWCPVRADGHAAVIEGERRTLRLVIEEPAGATFSAEEFRVEPRQPDPPRMLRRLTCRISPAPDTRCTIRMKIEAK